MRCRTASSAPACIAILARLQGRKLEMKAKLDKAVAWYFSCKEVKSGAFNTGFQAFSLHHPTRADNKICRVVPGAAVL